MDYNPKTGELFIGTTKGLNTVEIGKSEKVASDLDEIVVYPNPFYPNNGEEVNIENKSGENMPLGDNKCHIYDLSGELVVTLEENRFYQFSWDGENGASNDCAAGVYFFVIDTEQGDSKRGKIILMK